MSHDLLPQKNHSTELAFDPSDAMVETGMFERRDWTHVEVGHVLKEGVELPTNVPQCVWISFVTEAKFDADDASGTINRRSRTGFIVCLHISPIYWNSKKLNSVEPSSFGSEFIVMKQLFVNV